MIYVSDALVGQVEYLIDQSIQGNHILFDPETLRNALSSPGLPEEDAFEDDRYSAEPHIERLIELPSLEEKRRYLSALDPETRAGVVRTYFHIVENSLYEKFEARH